MNDVQYLLSLQDKRARAKCRLFDKEVEIINRINHGAVQGIKYDTVKIKINTTRNHIEELFIEHAKLGEEIKKYQKYREPFIEFLKPLKNLKTSSGEKYQTVLRRYYSLEIYYTLYGNYQETIAMYGITKTTLNKYFETGNRLLSEYYKNADLLEKFPLLFEITVN